MASFFYRFVETEVNYRTVQKCTYHCSPGNLSDLSIGQFDDEEEEGEKPIEDSHKHHPSKWGKSEIFCACNQCPYQQAQNLKNKRITVVFKYLIHGKLK